MSSRPERWPHFSNLRKIKHGDAVRSCNVHYSDVSLSSNFVSTGRKSSLETLGREPATYALDLRSRLAETP